MTIIVRFTLILSGAELSVRLALLGAIIFFGPRSVFEYMAHHGHFIRKIMAACLNVLSKLCSKRPSLEEEATGETRSDQSHDCATSIRNDIFAHDDYRFQGKILKHTGYWRSTLYSLPVPSMLTLRPSWNEALKCDIHSHKEIPCLWGMRSFFTSFSPFFKKPLDGPLLTKKIVTRSSCR